MRRYIAATVGCALFSTLYESFSHGVYSPYMVGLFTVPLLLGVIPALLCSLRTIDVSPLTRELWGCAVLTLTLGCCFAGVLEIYGTTSALLPLYAVVGAGLGLATLGTALRGTKAGR